MAGKLTGNDERMPHHEEDEGRARESQRGDRPQDDERWDEARHSETDAPHEEQHPETIHQPHQGEEGQDVV